MKIYGNEKTGLDLSSHAAIVYSEITPLQIIENDDGTYSIRGCIEDDNLTAQEVNDLLEDFDSRVLNDYNVEIDYETAVQLMDDDLREELHANLAPCTNQKFFEAYCEAYEEKYGEEWELAKKNPVY